MMRILLSILLLGIVGVGSLSAQSATGKKTNDTQNKTNTRSAETVVRDVLPRDRVVLDNAESDYNSVTWSRDVYRIVDIDNEKNAAFFYPQKSDNHQINLFSLIFNLVKDEKVQAYQFNLQNKMGYEDIQPIEFADMLKLHSIAYTTGAGGNISVSDYDMPTEEIRSFYVREKWVFDPRTGRGDVRVVAVCPVLHRPESYEFPEAPILRIPLFWVAMEDMAQYLNRAVNYTAVTDVSKYSSNLSMYDVLRNRFYDGKIYQMGDRVLVEFYSSEEELAVEQERLDTELNALMKRFNTLR